MFVDSRDTSLVTAPNIVGINPAETRFTQAHDYYEQEEPIQVARAVADTRNPQQKAQDWLNGVAGESDEVKDMVLQQLWKKEDFQNA